MEIMSIITTFMGNAWKIFTETKFPGTNMSFAIILVGCILIGIGFQLLSHALGASFSPGAFYRSASSANAKISDRRKNDEK